MVWACIGVERLGYRVQGLRFLSIALGYRVQSLGTRGFGQDCSYV